MKDFNKGGRFGGGGGDRRGPGGFKPRFGGGDRGDRPQLYQATCAECKKSCEVPFRPNGEKPVYCRDCFSTKSPAGGREFSPRPARPSFGARKPFGAPRDDFRAPREENRGSDQGVRELKTQMEAISGKLNRLIETLAAQNTAGSSAKVSKEKTLGAVVSSVAKKKKAKKASKK